MVNILCFLYGRLSKPCVVYDAIGFLFPFKTAVAPRNVKIYPKIIIIIYVALIVLLDTVVTNDDDCTTIVYNE